MPKLSTVVALLCGIVAIPCLYGPTSPPSNNVDAGMKHAWRSDLLFSSVPALLTQFPSSLSRQPRGGDALAQATVTLSSGFDLEGEVIPTITNNVGYNCQTLAAVQFEGYKIWGNNGVSVPGNCAFVNYTSVPSMTLTGAKGLMQCEATVFYECVAILVDTSSGVIVWNDGYKSGDLLSGPQWVTRQASYQPLSGVTTGAGKLQLQLFMFVGQHL